MRSRQAIGGSDFSHDSLRSRTDVLQAVTGRVTVFATEERLFHHTSKILVAVSGGPDSVALLLVLRHLRERFAFDVVASHFNHGLRPSSGDDLAFVRQLCERLGIDCFTGEGDVAAAAREHKRGIEETARRMRYEFLAFIAAKEHADSIAAGHTYDDQAETVVMRIVRGSGVRGIRGMLPVSGVPGAAAQRLIRPLLCVRRSETLALCVEAGIEPRIDPSNQDRAFRRNVVRHETLEALARMNPSIENALVGLAASAREVFDGIERQAMLLQPARRLPVGAIFPAAAFRDLSAEARTLVVEREAAFYSLPTELNRTRVRNLAAALKAGSGRVRFGEAEVEVSSGRVRIGPRPQAAKELPSKVLNVPGVTAAGPWRITIATEPLPEAPPLSATLSAAALRGALRVRTLAPSDRMTYHGISRKVSDIIANARVPAWERRTTLAVADSAAVVALFGAFGVFADALTGEDLLYVGVTPV